MKVLDFGLAKALEPVSARSTDATASPTITSPAMTRVGVILGTAAYMSPEQAKGREADKRSDIWGFGCVLYEMLTGRRAFDGEDMTDVLGAVVRLEPDWKAVPSDVTPAVRTLLRSCLVKDRRQRVGDMSTVLFVLANTASLTVTAPGHGGSHDARFGDGREAKLAANGRHRCGRAGRRSRGVGAGTFDARPPHPRPSSRRFACPWFHRPMSPSLRASISSFPSCRPMAAASRSARPGLASRSASGSARSSRWTHGRSPALTTPAGRSGRRTAARWPSSPTAS